MTTAYFDASALVKLVLAEDESDALRRFVDTQELRTVSCELARVEIVRVVRRGAPRAMVEARALIDELQVIEVTNAMLDLAGNIDPPHLRTIDAIHLAAASTLERDLQAIVTYDRRMQTGAAMLGLPVESPT